MTPYEAAEVFALFELADDFDCGLFWRVDMAPGGSREMRLFAARKRKLRPQGPCYKDMEDGVAALYDACCTQEERKAADDKDAAWWNAFAHRNRSKVDPAPGSSSAKS